MEEAGRRPSFQEVIEALDEYLAFLDEYLSKLVELYRRRGRALRVLMRPDELAELARGLSDEEAGRLFKTLLSLSGIAATLSQMGSLEPDDLERLRAEIKRARGVLRGHTGA